MCNRFSLDMSLQTVGYLLFCTVIIVLVISRFAAFVAFMRQRYPKLGEAMSRTPLDSLEEKYREAERQEEIHASDCLEKIARKKETLALCSDRWNDFSERTHDLENYADHRCGAKWLRMRDRLQSELISLRTDFKLKCPKKYVLT